MKTTRYMTLGLAAALLCTIVAPAAAQQESYSERMARARKLRLSGQTREALVIYDAVLERNANDVDALVQRGFCLIRESDRLDEALADFEKVIGRSPTYTDAYIGAAITHRRLGNRKAAREVLLKAETACRESESKMRYLATTAWREGYFGIARRLDKEFPPKEDRVLMDDPRTLSFSYSHDWLERGDDWDAVGVSYSHRIRPDLSLSFSFKEWWRYGRDDWIGKAGASYRYRKGLGFSYTGYFSDTRGFLANQKHTAVANVSTWRGGSIDGGMSFGNYGEGWSERVKLGATQYVKNFYARYSTSFGKDTKSQSVKSHSVSVGYSKDLAYAISAGFAQGEETVEIQRRSGFIFRTDDVETASLNLRYYITDQCGVGLGGLYEWRNEETFRRGGTVSTFIRF